MDIHEPPRILAIFHPQAWINDYAVEIDGQRTIDVTERILAMPRAQALAIRNDQLESDHLLTDEEMNHHSGPFYIEVEHAIDAYYFPCQPAQLESPRS